MSIGNVVLSLEDFGYATSTAMQIYSAAWALPGIPIILLGLAGAYRGVEIYVRIYLYYLVVSCVIDTAYLVQLFVMTDTCVHLTGAALVKNGRAFACGVAQSLSITTAIAGVIVQLYLVYAVWSFCDHLNSTGSAGVISKLLASCEEDSQTTRLHCDQDDCWAIDRGGLGSNYNSITQPMGKPFGHFLPTPMYNQPFMQA